MTERRRILTLFCGLTAGCWGTGRGWAQEPAAGGIADYEPKARVILRLVSESDAAAFSPDGSMLATGQDDGAILLWDIETERPLRRFEGHADAVTRLGFTPDGRLMASGGCDQQIRVWDVETGESLKVLESHSSRIAALAFSMGGQWLLSGGYDKAARLWNLADPSNSSTVLWNAEGAVSAAAFSGDAGHWAAGDFSGEIHVGSVSSGTEPLTFKAHQGPVRSLLFTRDGTALLSGGDDGEIFIWNVATGEQLKRLADGPHPAHSDPVTGLAVFDDGGLLASGSRKGTIRTWDIRSGEFTSTLEGFQEEVQALAFRAGAKSVVAVSRDQTARQWMSKLPPTPRLAILEGASRRLWTLAVGPGSATLLAGGKQGYLTEWSLATGEELRTLKGFGGTIDAICVSPAGDRLACCGWREKRVAVFNLQTGERDHEIPTESPARCVRYSPDGRWLVLGCEDGTAQIVTCDGSADPRVLQCGPLSVYDVSFSPEGSRLAICTGDWKQPQPGKISIWNTAGWTEIQQFSGHRTAIRSVVYSPDGDRLASSGEDGQVIIWHGTSHVQLTQLENSTGTRPLAFSPDGLELAVGLHDGVINIWNMETGRLVRRFRTESDVFALQYSADGSVLFSVSGEPRIEIWPGHPRPTTEQRIRDWTK